MSWSHWMARDWFLEDPTKIKRNKTNRMIRCAYMPNGFYQIEQYSMESHICTTHHLEPGETLEDENVILTVDGHPGPMSDWKYKIYVAKVQIKPEREIEVEWL